MFWFYAISKSYQRNILVLSVYNSPNLQPKSVQGRDKFSFKLNELSFAGLNENVRLARQEIRAFHQEFGYPKSDSFIKLRIFKHQNDIKYADIIEKLKIKTKEYSDRFVNNYLFELFTNKGNSKISRREYYQELGQIIKKYNFANCDQQSELLCNQLNEKGIKAKVVNFFIYTKNNKQRRECGSHSFVILDMKQGAKISNPKTWGEDAVLVDTWINQAEPTDIGLKYLQEMFVFNPKTEYIEYIDPNKPLKVGFIGKIFRLINNLSIKYNKTKN